MDFFSPEIRRNPFPMYDQLRAASPILHDLQTDSRILFDYDSVKQALTDHERFTEKRRNPSALRDALFARCCQHQLQQTHNLAVIDPTRNFFKQQMMSDRIEVCPQIRIYHVSFSLNNCRCHSMHRLMCGAFGSITIRT